MGPLINIQNYDIDGPNNDGASVAEKNRAILAAAARRRDAGHNERYYDEVGLRFFRYGSDHFFTRWSTSAESESD